MRNNKIISKILILSFTIVTSSLLPTLTTVVHPITSIILFSAFVVMIAYIIYRLLKEVNSKIKKDYYDAFLKQNKVNHKLSDDIAELERRLDGNDN